ncbi:MAG: class I SAM-dependent methyltransferase [Alphaproteobacteria bacterium]|nr:class I SAM-dependent methyltransferase [Alphaproteobacteria bacterium]
MSRSSQSFRATWRRLTLGLPTLLGWAQRGYFIPYRYADSIPDTSARIPFPHIETLFQAAEPTFLSLLDATDLIADIATRFDGTAPPLPRWQQSWFPRLDGLAAYLMVRRHQPARIIEIGSGHSTRFIAAAIQDGGLSTQITAIDPAPRADIANLSGVTTHRTTLQQADMSVFEGLKPNDMVMIDSSHIAMPGSDVDILLGRILPCLPKGVLIQIHDIFLPDPYPDSWAWRGYNEQLPVATLLAGGGFEPLWSSHWIATRCADFLAKNAIGALPLAEGAPESAIWLRRC